MNIEIIRAKPEDAEGITNVLYKAWLATYPNEEAGITTEDIELTYKDSFTQEKIKKQQAAIANSPESVNRFIAKDGNKIVGVSTLINNETNDQLRTIYILPEYQRKGIGMMLWNKVKEFRRADKDTIVEVATYNTQAIEFYKKLGFVDTGKRFSDEKFRMKSGAILPEMEMVIKANTVV